ncbi:hypothetical protein EB796_003171 [Bugula neritina]|uniref:Uncharacterized protein n=1 Tax=Bugula neritina TaxID=10212 RepID=A0A7J7KKR3_BUGNE|nr:hypothetical protein EB796_003171 [Bugula neritina]
MFGHLGGSVTSHIYFKVQMCQNCSDIRNIHCRSFSIELSSIRENIVVDNQSSSLAVSLILYTYKFFQLHGDHSLICLIRLNTFYEKTFTTILHSTYENINAAQLYNQIY